MESIGRLAHHSMTPFCRFGSARRLVWKENSGSKYFRTIFQRCPSFTPTASPRMLVLCQLGAAKGILSNLPAEVFAHIQVSWLWVGYRICCKLLTKCVHDFFTIAPTACVILIE